MIPILHEQEERLAQRLEAARMALPRMQETGRFERLAVPLTICKCLISHIIPRYPALSLLNEDRALCVIKPESNLLELDQAKSNLIQPVPRQNGPLL
jgi:hypothetical protein